MENTDQLKNRRIVPTASAILDDATIVEMTFRPDLRRTVFAIYNSGRWTLQDAINIGPDARLVPFSANNNLIKNGVVLLPSETRMYGSEAELVADIRAFIHRYVDFSESFENVATHYVLLTWLYDAFNELPYLRLAAYCVVPGLPKCGIQPWLSPARGPPKGHPMARGRSLTEFQKEFPDEAPCLYFQ